MKIIPAIDIIDGKCVRLTQGNYSQCKIYSESPVEVAKAFEEVGVSRLHLVDLDGAKAAGVVNIKVLEDICRYTTLSVDFGGGIKREEDIRKVFDAGADYACIGSIVQTDREKTRQWLQTYGTEKIIVGADVWNTKICIQGWKKITDTTIFDLIADYEGLIHNLMCTDITRDGMLEGPALGLYQELIVRYPGIKLNASGGVSSHEDLGKLERIGVKSVIVGKAIYEKKIVLEKLLNGNMVKSIK